MNIETNWAYALLVTDTPIPASLYCVNESHTILLKSCPRLFVPENAALAYLPSIFSPILPVIKFVQFLAYGDLHLPLGPSFAGPGPTYPLLVAVASPAVISAWIGGKARHPQPSCSTPKLEAAKFKFSTKHPLLTWNISSFTLVGTTVTNLKSWPDTDTSVLRPTGLFSK